MGVGGQKKFSNGVVILVNTGEKGGQRGVFVATGYGLEGAVTDLVAGEIVQNNLIPNFKAGNNYLGLNEATDNIIKAAEGRYKAPEDYHSGGGGFSVLGMIIVFIIVIVLLALIFGKGNGVMVVMYPVGATQITGPDREVIRPGFFQVVAVAVVDGAAAVAAVSEALVVVALAAAGQAAVGKHLP